MLALALAVLQEWIVALVAVAVFLVVLVSIRVASSNRRRETDRRCAEHDLRGRGA